MTDPWSPDFPAAKDDDDDDVAWALSTAQVQWKRGSRADAVVWLRRAIDSAVAVGATWRAAELTRETDALEAFLVGGRAAPGPPSMQGEVVVDEDYDGTDMIDEEVMSLPSDAQMSAQLGEDADEQLTPLTSLSSLSADATDELTDVTPDEDQPPANAPPDAEAEEEEIVEIDDDEISDEDLAVDELINGDLPRFSSESPTANIPLPAFPPDPDREPESDPSPTPVRLSVADPFYRPEPEPQQSTGYGLRASGPPERGAWRPESEARSPEPEQATGYGLRASGPPERGAWRPESEARSPEPEARSPEPEARSPEPEARSPEPERESAEPEPEVRSPEPEVRSPEPEVRSPEPEVRSPEPEVRSPEPEVRSSEPEAEPVLTEPIIVGISLAEIRGFEDFPPETQLELARVARVERLATEEEVSGFGLALVLRGAANVMPAIADVACGTAGERELVYGRGTLQEGVALRLVATAPDTQIAIWDFEVIEPPLADCPWVLEELQEVADRYQALAGVSMGPMGERLDDALRGMVLSRCKLVRLLPWEVLVENGKPVGGLFIVGAGRLLLGDDPAKPGSGGELGPGEFLFAAQVLSAGAAPTVARAGASGALLMAADRHAAHELMLIVPPLLELLAG